MPVCKLLARFSAVPSAPLTKICVWYLPLVRFFTSSAKCCATLYDVSCIVSAVANFN